MDYKTKKSEAEDPFFIAEFEHVDEGRVKALDAFVHLLLWISEGRSISDRGLRATILVYCVRNDLLGGASLAEIGEAAGCTKQYVFKLLSELKNLVGEF